jgi:hypothetical protein
MTTTAEDRAAAALAPYLRADTDAWAVARQVLAAAVPQEMLQVTQIKDDRFLLEVRKPVTAKIAMFIQAVVKADEQMAAEAPDRPLEMLQ